MTRFRTAAALFVFDPWSPAVPLVAGNKAGDWTRWYKNTIPIAEVEYKECCGRVV